MMPKKLTGATLDKTLSPENMAKIKSKAKAQIGRMRAAAGENPEPEELYSGDMHKLLKEQNSDR